MLRLREIQPELITAMLLTQGWGAANFRCIAEVNDGARRAMRMLNGGSRKTDFRRRSLTPTETGKAIWEFPTVWLMGRETGYWETTAVPKLEARLPRAP